MVSGGARSKSRFVHETVQRGCSPVEDLAVLRRAASSLLWHARPKVRFGGRGGAGSELERRSLIKGCCKAERSGEGGLKLY